jgi:hypothetical protein
MLCKYCNKDIPEDNFQIHEVNCERNNIECEKCKEIVPKSSIDQHLMIHQEKTCKNCEIAFESRYFDSHLCSDPLKTCKYCEATMKTSVFEEHFSQCENRTEQCLKCEKFIKNKDMEKHKELNQCAALDYLSIGSSSSSDSFSSSYIKIKGNYSDSLLTKNSTKLSIFRGTFISVCVGVRINAPRINRFYDKDAYEKWISKNYDN